MDDQGPRRRGRLELGGPGPHQRVHDRLERRTTVGVGEHEARRAGPGRAPPSGPSTSGPNAATTAAESRRPGADDLAGEGVRVDDDGTQLAQDRGHRALARGDAAGQTHTHGKNPT